MSENPIQVNMDTYPFRYGTVIEKACKRWILIIYVAYKDCDGGCIAHFRMIWYLQEIFQTKPSVDSKRRNLNPISIQTSLENVIIKMK